MSGRRLSPVVASGTLAALGALHALWATGSHWPVAEAGDVSGRPEAESPGPAACLTVAGLLFTSAGLVAGRPRRYPRLRSAGAAGVVGVLAVRGGLGLAGRTDLVSPGSTSERFRRRDRSFYSPLCLTIAAMAAPSVTNLHP